MEKIEWEGGGGGSIKIFRQKFIVPQCRKISQGNRFSPEYKYFDQDLQTVKIETTV